MCDHFRAKSDADLNRMVQLTEEVLKPGNHSGRGSRFRFVRLVSSANLAPQDLDAEPPSDAELPAPKHQKVQGKAQNRAHPPGPEAMHPAIKKYLEAAPAPASAARRAACGRKLEAAQPAPPEPEAEKASQPQPAQPADSGAPEPATQEMEYWGGDTESQPTWLETDSDVAAAPTLLESETQSLARGDDTQASHRPQGPQPGPLPAPTD